jgi:protease II
MFHSRSKHIELRYHWIRDVLKNKELVLEKIHTSKNYLDMLTKPIPSLKLEVCREKAGLIGEHAP